MCKKSVSHDSVRQASIPLMASDQDALDEQCNAEVVVGPGGPDDFARFYAAEIRSVINLGHALCGDRSIAEDLAQEGFAAEYRRWDKISLYDNPGAFVRRVVANRRVSVFRRQMSERKTLARLAGRQERPADPLLPSPAAEVWAAVRSLPRRQAQVVALHYVDGLPLSEIAAVLEISKSSTNTYLRRARSTLAERLRHLENQ